MRTKLSMIKSAMKAPQYENLTTQELNIFQSGFRNGFNIAHLEFKEKIKKLHIIIKHLKKRQPILIQTDLKKTASANDMKKVLQWVSNKFNVDENVITAKSRLADVTKLRSLALNIIYENYDVSTPAMGRFFNMDHTSILHHINNKMNLKSCWKSNSNLWKYYNEFTL